jgi:methionyl-tRNA formyltransferase
MMPQPNVLILSTWGASILVPYLEAFQNHGIGIQAIIFDGVQSKTSLDIHNERTKGFFQDRSIFDLKGLMVPGYFIDNHNGVDCLDLIRSLKGQILVNAGVRRILSADLLAAADIGIINSHPGIMPKYRGCSCLEWAIFNDDAVGSTCHFMNAEIDAGPIIFQAEMPIRPGEVYESVRARIINHGAETAAKGCRRVIDESLHPERMPPVPTDSYFDLMSEKQFQEVRRKLSEDRYGKMTLSQT